MAILTWNVPNTKIWMDMACQS